MSTNPVTGTRIPIYSWHQRPSFRRPPPAAADTQHTTPGWQTPLADYSAAGISTPTPRRQTTPNVPAGGGKPGPRIVRQSQ